MNVTQKSKSHTWEPYQRSGLVPEVRVAFFFLSVLQRLGFQTITVLMWYNRVDFGLFIYFFCAYGLPSARPQISRRIGRLVLILVMGVSPFDVLC